jgi:hypothetical protein|tara:strand:- start:870 stop:1073 length:204 start_codon:yes stop_codon:yes gene_type:complete
MHDLSQSPAVLNHKALGTATKALSRARDANYAAESYPVGSGSHKALKASAIAELDVVEHMINQARKG